jgi:hypothetical protein
MSPMPPALSKGGEEEILLSLFAHHCTQLIDSLLDAVHTSPLRQPYAPPRLVSTRKKHAGLATPLPCSQPMPFLLDDVHVTQDIAKLRP